MRQLREVLDIRASNLDLVRSIYADRERGDYGRADWVDREIEFVRADGPAPGSWTGLAEMQRRGATFSAPGTNTAAKPRATASWTNGRVLVLSRNGARGKTSEAVIGTDAALLFHVRNAKVTRLVLYWDRDRALADLGLTSEGD
jgi:ketosteroid isomerase-like protein